MTKELSAFDDSISTASDSTNTDYITVSRKRFEAMENVIRAAQDCKAWINHYWERDHLELTKTLEALAKVDGEGESEAYTCHLL